MMLKSAGARLGRARIPAPLPVAAVAVIAVIAAVAVMTAFVSPVAAREGTLVQKLPNGLTVILEEDHSRPLIGVSLCVNGGSRTETPEISGLSHYYEHLMYRGGSKEQKPLEFRREMQQLGDESGGYTTEDYTNFGFTVPKVNFDEAFRRATDDWLHLEVTQEKIDAERQVVLEEYNQDEDRPDYQVEVELLKLIYKVHPYRVGPIGLRKVIEGANLQTFRTFYEDRYVPNQMVLSMVGDFDADSMLAKVVASWGTRPAGPSSFERGLTEPEQKEFRFNERPMKTATRKVILAFPIPPATHADIPALEMTAALLGSGSSSRLWQALKVRNNLAVSLACYVDKRTDPGYIGVYLDLEPARTEAALNEVTRELSRLCREPPSMDELSRVREMILAQRERSLQTVFGRAEALGAAEVKGSALDVDRYPALIRAVTREDISRIAATYLKPDRADLSIIRPDTSAAFDPAPMVQRWREDFGPEQTSSKSSAAEPVRTVLDNGVVLLVRPMPQATMVGAVVLVRGGQWAEPSGEEGIANFTANLLDRGAAGKSQTEIADRLGSLGATLNTWGESDDIAASMEVPPENHRAALELLGDVIASPTFPPAEIEKLRTDELAEISSIPDRPFENTNRAFYSELYKNSPYRNPVIGTERSVTSFTEDQVRAFYRTAFTGKNTFVVVAGPVDPGAIRNWAQEKLGQLPAGAPVRIGGVEDQSPASPVDTLIVRDQEQVAFNTGWPTLSVTDPDYIPLRVAVRVLGDWYFYTYVYSKGVAYRSWFYMTQRLGQGSVQNEMGVSPGVYKEISGDVIADLSHYVGGVFPDDEFQAAKRRLISAHYLEGQTSIGLARQLAFWEMAGPGEQFYDSIPARIEAVTSAQAEAAARKYLHPDRYLRVGIGKAS
jgi:zinc protease